MVSGCYSSSSSLPLYTVALDWLCSWSCAPFLSLIMLFLRFVDLFFVCLARRDSQADRPFGLYIYLAPYTFRRGFVVCGRRAAYSLLPLSDASLFSCFFTWYLGREAIQTDGSRRHLHLCDVFEPVFVVILPSPPSTFLHFKI